MRSDLPAEQESTEDEAPGNNHREIVPLGAAHWPRWSGAYEPTPEPAHYVEASAVQAAIAAAVEPWRAAWRSTRIRALADFVANEATSLGGSSEAVQAAWMSAGNAAAVLDDASLGNDGAAYSTARAAGHQAGTWVASSSPPPKRGDRDSRHARSRSRC